MSARVQMIEQHYGALLDGAGAGIAGRLDTLERALEAELEAGREAAGESGSRPRS